tara:strand:- start:184 stop:336 length:153 start_codon:yes stop_codon:yes gene_type:complete
MIETALKLLALDNWYGISENIEIAKGKYEYADTFKKGINKIKRDIQWQKR